MNNYPLWYPSLQAINMNSMQIIPSTSNTDSSNHNYQQIAKDFLEKYVTATNNLGISCTAYYYTTDARFSIHLHQGVINQLYEIVGHNNFRAKLSELGILLMKYNGLIPTIQPLGKNSILITFYGQAEINGKMYNIETVFVARLVSESPRIVNHIVNIFM
jgi:hypothetical protein